MLVEVAVDHEHDVLQDAHAADDGKKLDVRLAQAGAAADDVDDEVREQQVVLDHGQVQGVGGVAALAIGELDGLVEPRGGDLQRDVGEIAGQGLVADEIAVGAEALAFKDPGDGLGPENLRHPLVAPEVAGKHDEIDVAGVVGDQLLASQGAQSLAEGRAVPPAA